MTSNGIAKFYKTSVHVWTILKYHKGEQFQLANKKMFPKISKTRKTQTIINMDPNLDKVKSQLAGGGGGQQKVRICHVHHSKSLNTIQAGKWMSSLICAKSVADPGLPIRGRQPKGGARQPMIWPIFTKNSAWKQRKLGREGGACVPYAPRSANVIYIRISGASDFVVPEIDGYVEYVRHVPAHLPPQQNVRLVWIFRDHHQPKLLVNLCAIEFFFKLFIIFS